MKYPFKGSYRITQYFAENPQAYSQFGLKGHNGIDFALPTGTEVTATHSGKVIEATNDSTGYGLYIKLEDDVQGSLYAHLREFKVSVGNNINEGQVIGISDNTGNSTGPHLHFGYYKKPRDRGNGYAGYIDPLPFLQEQEPMITMTVKEADAIRLRRDELYNESLLLKNKIFWLNDQVKALQTKNDSLQFQITTLLNSLDDLRKELNDYKTSHPDVPNLLPGSSTMPPSSGNGKSIWQRILEFFNQPL